MPLTAVAFWMVYVAGVFGALFFPLSGVLLYLLVYHLNPEQQWWGESVRASGVRTSMTIAVATLIGLIGRRPQFVARAKQLLFPMPVVIVFVLLVAASLSWGHGYNERGAYQVEKLIKILIFLMILIRCVRTPRHYQLVIWSWVVGVIYICYQAWGNVGVHADGRLAWGLGGADFADSGDLAEHLIATLPMIGALLFMSRSIWSRGLLLCAGALTINTIIMTRTRSALLGLIAMTLTAVVSLPRGYRMRGLAGIAVGALLAAQLTDPGWWRRMETISTQPHDASAIGRLAYWRAAVHMASDNPFGIGIGNFQTAVREYIPSLDRTRSAHNTYLECLAETGYLGLLMLMVIIAAMLARVSRICRDAGRGGPNIDKNPAEREIRFHLGWHAMALRAGLVGYLVCAVFQSRVGGEDFWILLALCVCLSNVSEHMRAPLDSTIEDDEISSLPSLALAGANQCESPS